MDAELNKKVTKIWPKARQAEMPDEQNVFLDNTGKDKLADTDMDTRDPIVPHNTEQRYKPFRHRYAPQIHRHNNRHVSLREHNDACVLCTNSFSRDAPSV
ncbi:hypothetical protein Back11_26330 [Paenibacillus baekrokdamisoli]|uniref:Uncharacterized protein n=1 Tax=Paenibacillus baekrokdamisoli TaxID=1712516 RepID=A0A3G9JBN5_9BACL|nr:hypothetical protein Back11_26330 [Paenibacillus baekrokdamisoli]